MQSLCEQRFPTGADLDSVDFSWTLSLGSQRANSVKQGQCHRDGYVGQCRPRAPHAPCCGGQTRMPCTVTPHLPVPQDKAVAEPVGRLLESALRSSHLPSRIGALHGVLYVLECDLLDDTAKQLIPVVSDYVLANLKAVAP